MATDFLYFGCTLSVLLLYSGFIVINPWVFTCDQSYCQPFLSWAQYRTDPQNWFLVLGEFQIKVKVTLYVNFPGAQLTLSVLRKSGTGNYLIFYPSCHRVLFTLSFPEFSFYWPLVTQFGTLTHAFIPITFHRRVGVLALQRLDLIIIRFRKEGHNPDLPNNVLSKMC